MYSSAAYKTALTLGATPGDSPEDAVQGCSLQGLVGAQEVVDPLPLHHGMAQGRPAGNGSPGAVMWLPVGGGTAIICHMTKYPLGPPGGCAERPKTVQEFPRPLEDRTPVLVAVFAHPDDETFIAGGTLAQHAARGWDVHLVCATNGGLGSRGREPGESAESYQRRRVRELQEAVRRLGLRSLTLLGLQDGGLQSEGPRRKEIVRQLLQYFYSVAPDVVVSFGADGISGHPDHVAISALARDAFRRYCAAVSRPESRPVFYAVVDSPAIPKCCKKNGRQNDSPTITTVVDTRRSWNRKLAAMEAYGSQSHILESLRGDPVGWRIREEWFAQQEKCFQIQEGITDGRSERD